MRIDDDGRIAYVQPSVTHLQRHTLVSVREQISVLLIQRMMHDYTTIQLLGIGRS